MNCFYSCSFTKQGPWENTVESGCCQHHNYTITIKNCTFIITTSIIRLKSRAESAVTVTVVSIVVFLAKQPCTEYERTYRKAWDSRWASNTRRTKETLKRQKAFMCMCLCHCMFICLCDCVCKKTALKWMCLCHVLLCLYKNTKY